MAKKRRRKENHENHDRWLVSYADFITLLFAFFTVLYATAHRDLEKERNFEDSIKKAFRSFVDMGGGQGEGGLYPGVKKGNIIPPILKVFPPKGSGPNEMLDALERIVESKLGKEKRKKMISSLRHDSMGVRMSLAASTLFKVGSDQISEGAIESLDEIARIVKASGRRLLIEGHTDNVPIRTKQFPSNWELASARATRIVRYLMDRHEIPASRLVALSYADQRPIGDNSTRKGRSKNRRIEILIVTDPKFET